MLSLKRTLLAAAAFVPLGVVAQPQIITVVVGNNTFDPDNIVANTKDVLEFQFDKGNYSVVAGAYNKPCTPLGRKGGFFSGMVEKEEDDDVHVFRVTLNHTDPIVFYSSFEDQCSTGMVGIVNANSNHTLKSYERSSSSVAKAATPDPDDEAYGGVFVDADVLGVNKHNGGISGSDSDDDDDDHPGSTLNAFTGMPNGAGILEAPVFAGLAAVAMGLACAMA